MAAPTRLLWILVLAAGLAASAVGANADPATRDSERIERFGYWYVVKKPATYVIVGTGQRGRYSLCSALFLGKNASLEFEAKNDKAWSVYVANKSWSYSPGIRRLTLQSGSQKLGIAAALYGGAMISGMSHNLQGGKPIPMKGFLSFISRGEPISFYDDRGRKLVTFPNEGSDLIQAFRQAIKCSLANAPG